MSQKTGRNEPCPCGSGKKYKRCCLERDEDARRELAQQTLWDDDDAPEEADELDDDEPLSVSADEIVKVRHSCGMVKTLRQALTGDGLQTIEWVAPAIPREILDSIEREALDELDGSWGDPKAADPIQVDVVEVDTGGDYFMVEVFNRALLLLHAGNEDVTRMHRVFCILEDAARRGAAGPSDGVPASPPEASGETAPEPAPSFGLEQVVKAHGQQGGACQLCGAELRRNSAIRHLAECAPAHDARIGEVKTLVYLRVTAPGLAGYWLDLEARDDARLEMVDRFLREVWVECCGHLSAFKIGNVDYSLAAYEPTGWPAGFGSRRLHRTMNTRLRDALSDSGGRFTYEYDFGSTTTLQLDVKGERTGRIGRAATRLLARNAPLIWPCATCGEPASVVCTACICESANPFVCENHSRGRHACGESEMLLPVVNSPRMGICGYTG